MRYFFVVHKCMPEKLVFVYLFVLINLEIYFFCLFYQTRHFEIGFIFVPTGQLKSNANSCILLTTPFTRNSFGECTPVFILLTLNSFVETAHHIWAEEIQNSCSCVYFMPGNFPSGLLSFSQLLYAIYACLVPPLSAIFSPVQ